MSPWSAISGYFVLTMRLRLLHDCRTDECRRAYVRHAHPALAWASSMNAIKSSLGTPVARSCASPARLTVVSSCSRAWQSLVATAPAIRARSDGSYVAQRTASALAQLTSANEATRPRTPARMRLPTLRASEGGDSNAKQ